MLRITVLGSAAQAVTHFKEFDIAVFVETLHAGDAILDAQTQQHLSHIFIDLFHKQRQMLGRIRIDLCQRNKAVCVTSDIFICHRAGCDLTIYKGIIGADLKAIIELFNRYFAAAGIALCKLVQLYEVLSILTLHNTSAAAVVNRFDNYRVLQFSRRAFQIGFVDLKIHHGRHTVLTTSLLKQTLIHQCVPQLAGRIEGQIQFFRNVDSSGNNIFITAHKHTVNILFLDQISQRLPIQDIDHVALFNDLHDFLSKRLTCNHDRHTIFIRKTRDIRGIIGTAQDQKPFTSQFHDVYSLLLNLNFYCFLRVFANCHGRNCIFRLGDDEADAVAAGADLTGNISHLLGKGDLLHTGDVLSIFHTLNSGDRAARRIQEPDSAALLILRRDVRSQSQANVDGRLDHINTGRQGDQVSGDAIAAHAGAQFHHFGSFFG